MKVRNKNGLGKWVKTMLNFQDYKKLKKLAVDKDISLAKLMREALETLLEEQG